MNTTAPSAVPTSLSFLKAPVDKVPVLRVQYQNSLTRSQQAATRNRGKAIVNSPQLIYDQEPFMVAEDDETSKDKHVTRECQKPKWANDAAYHMEKMLLCKQEEAGIQLNAVQADWRDDINDDEL
nr:hypothetical protein [Tanacetum cinerariifolium]